MVALPITKDVRATSTTTVRTSRDVNEAKRLTKVAPPRGLEP